MCDLQNRTHTECPSPVYRFSHSTKQCSSKPVTSCCYDYTVSWYLICLYFSLMFGSLYWFPTCMVYNCITNIWNNLLLITVWTICMAMTHDFQQCGILTSVDTDKPLQPPLKLRSFKWCSASSLTHIEYSSDKHRVWSVCPYAQAGLSLCWSHIPNCWKSHTTADIYREYQVWLFWNQIYQAQLQKCMLNCLPELHGSISVLKALPSKLDIKRFEPDILFIHLPIDSLLNLVIMT